VIGSSQNARFEAPGLAGHHIAEAIAGGLAACGLDVTPPERWRGFGIRIGCRVDDHEIEVTVVPEGPDVILQIAPTRVLSLGERLRAPHHPDAAACYRVAAVVHLVLVSEWRASGVRWRWDGPARDEDTPYPRALSSIQATIAT
jgi:hypothetical protein